MSSGTNPADIPSILQKSGYNQNAWNPATGQGPNLGGYFGGVGPQQQVQTNTNQGDQARAQQAQLAQQLTAAAQGNGPSAAQSQLQASTQQNIAQQAGLAAAMNAGGNAGAARQQLATQGANLNQQAALQGAQTRAQEQLGARGQLGSLLGEQRGQDLSQASLQQQAALANQANQLQSGEFNAGTQQNLASLLNNQFQYGTGLNFNAQQAEQQVKAQLAGAAAASQAAASSNNWNSAIGAGGQAASGVAGLLSQPSVPGGGGGYSTPTSSFAKGGIVTKPTVALIGEAGPEAVVPLHGQNASGFARSLMDQMVHMNKRLEALEGTHGQVDADDEDEYGD